MILELIRKDKEEVPRKVREKKDKQCKVFIIKIVRDAWKCKQMNGSY